MIIILNIYKYKMFLPISDKHAKQARNIRSFSSIPQFANDTRLLAIDISNAEADINNSFLIRLNVCIRSISFFKAKSNDLKYIFFKCITLCFYIIP